MPYVYWLCGIAMKGWRDGWLEYLDTIGGGNVVVLLLDFAAVYL